MSAKGSEGNQGSCEVGEGTPGSHLTRIKSFVGPSGSLLMQERYEA